MSPPRSSGFRTIYLWARFGAALALAPGLAACGSSSVPSGPSSPSGPSGSSVPGAAADAVPAVIGETLLVPSEHLGERRVVNVYLPPGYAAEADRDHRYPVLFMPDGGLGEDFPHVAGSVDVSIKNAVIRPVIVVGVENTVRRRDLVGPSEVPADLEAAPQAGGADRFRAFLRDELIPLIEQRYRTSGERALVGESLAGLFVVETFLVEPDLFDGYLAASPSVWWNAGALVQSASARLGAWAGRRAAQRAPRPKAIYLATADELAMQEGVTKLVDALEVQAPAGVTWRYEPMPHEHHSTIFPTAALHGIRWLFAAPAPE